MNYLNIHKLPKIFEIAQYITSSQGINNSVKKVRQNFEKFKKLLEDKENVFATFGTDRNCFDILLRSFKYEKNVDIQAIIKEAMECYVQARDDNFLNEFPSSSKEICTYLHASIHTTGDSFCAIDGTSSVEIIKLLLELGADPTMRGSIDRLSFYEYLKNAPIGNQQVKQILPFVEEIIEKKKNIDIFEQAVGVDYTISI